MTDEDRGRLNTIRAKYHVYIKTKYSNVLKRDILFFDIEEARGSMPFYQWEALWNDERDWHRLQGRIDYAKRKEDLSLDALLGRN